MPIQMPGDTRSTAIPSPPVPRRHTLPRERAYAPIRASTRLTWTACQVPRPLAVGMPRSLSAAAMPASDVTPAVCSSATTFCPDSENAYLIGAGTSFASPMAAAEAAVVKAQTHGAITGSALEMCILVSATNVTGKRPDPNYNYGRIDVLSALSNSSCKSGT